MDIKICPSSLSGKIMPPPSKSAVIRAIICSMFSKKPTTLICPFLCDDSAAALTCARSLGFSVLREAEKITVAPPENIFASDMLCCGDSAACLHFMLAYCAAVGGNYNFLLSPALLRRFPFELCACLEKNGISVALNKNVLTICGKLQKSRFEIDCSRSSQPGSALILASAAVGADVLVTNAVSKPYLDLTLGIMSEFSVTATLCDGVYSVPRQNYLRNTPLKIKPDMSCAAFFKAANFLGSSIEIQGGDDPLQSDSCMNKMLLSAKNGGGSFDITDCPDLFPPLAAALAASGGEYEIYGTQRLKSKESDRAACVVRMLCSIGGNLSCDGDVIRIKGRRLTGGCAPSFDDHRIAMAAAVAATVCTNPVIIENAQCVSKSYPLFWQEYKNLGGKIDASVF